MSHEEKSGAVRAETIEIASAISSLGLIWVTGRQAALATSLLTSAPAWQRIDPLPLLDEEDLDNTEGDGESIDIADHLFSNGVSAFRPR